MSEAVKPIRKPTENEVERLDLHDSIPTLVNSKTISFNTYSGKMTYMPDAQVIKFEAKGKLTGFMPITNVKFIWMK